MNKRINTVFIVGPTASGKTQLSIELAKRFNGEIISADSMQIYKGIHIASAAPDEEEMQGIKHHLLEFVETDVQFSVAEYVKLARDKITEVYSRGKLPIVVGGTGLYISSLLNDISFEESETDFELRDYLEKQFDELGGEVMLEKLAEFDKESAERLHPNNRRRIIRAFEVYETTGKTATELNLQSHNMDYGLNPFVIGITYDNRETLYERINKRVDIMLNNGLLEEAECAFNKNSGKAAFQAIGHKELFGYFKKEISLEEAVELLKQQTRRYAKRQLTWFRREKSINWVYPDLCEDVFDVSSDMLQKFLKEE